MALLRFPRLRNWKLLPSLCTATAQMLQSGAVSANFCKIFQCRESVSSKRRHFSGRNTTTLEFVCVCVLIFFQTFLGTVCLGRRKPWNWMRQMWEKSQALVSRFQRLLLLFFNLFTLSSGSLASQVPHGHFSFCGWSLSHRYRP